MKKYNLEYLDLDRQRYFFFRRIRNGVYEREDGEVMTRNYIEKRYDFIKNHKQARYEIITNANGFKIKRLIKVVL